MHGGVESWIRDRHFLLGHRGADAAFQASARDFVLCSQRSARPCQVVCMMNRYGFVIFVVCLHAAAHRSVLGLCSSVAMYASAASALPPEAVPEQHAQGSGRGPARRHAPAAAATRATSRVGVRVRTAVNTPRCCAGIRGLSGVGKGGAVGRSGRVCARGVGSAC